MCCFHIYSLQLIICGVEVCMCAIVPLAVKLALLHLCLLYISSSTVWKHAAAKPY